MTKRVRSVAMVFNAVRFGNDILAHRLELGLVGREVMSIIGKDSAAMYRYERGEEPNMKLQNFLALCNLYDLDPREYFELE